MTNYPPYIIGKQYSQWRELSGVSTPLLLLTKQRPAKTGTNKMEINLTNPTHFKMLSLIIEKAEELGMSLDEHTQVGYNSNSGYVWLWDECYMFSLGLTDFGYNRGETEVELILSCPETSEEFFSTNETDLYEQYREYCEAEGIECYV